MWVLFKVIIIQLFLMGTWMWEKKRRGEEHREVAEICAHLQDEYIYILYIYTYGMYTHTYNTMYKE